MLSGQRCSGRAADVNRPVTLPARWPCRYRGSTSPARRGSAIQRGNVTTHIREPALSGRAADVDRPVTPLPAAHVRHDKHHRDAGVRIRRPTHPALAVPLPGD
ncbi:MAG UNVERIFIED_CONTAM: hypothetical protein LVR18_39680 [Planctomycetaceae bacterium]